MPELYPDAVEGPYTVPSGTDIADGPQAFRDFADSLGGLSDTLEVFELAGDHTVTAVEMGGLFTHSGSGMTLTVNAGEHPVGSVMAVSNLSDEADAVVTVETPNLTETVGQYAIMSFTQVSVDVWVPNGGGAGGGGLKWAKSIESEADLAELDAEVVAAQEPDLTLWMRCGSGDWRMVCNETGQPVAKYAAFDADSSSGWAFSNYTQDGQEYLLATCDQGSIASLVISEQGIVDYFAIGGGGAGGRPAGCNVWAAGPGGGGGIAQGTFFVEPQTLYAAAGAGSTNGNGTRSLLYGTGMTYQVWIPGGTRGSQDNLNCPGGVNGSGGGYDNIYGNAGCGAGAGGADGSGITTKIDNYAVTYGEGGGKHEQRYGNKTTIVNGHGHGGPGDGSCGSQHGSGSGRVMVRVAI